jgi:hypothetical protein
MSPAVLVVIVVAILAVIGTGIGIAVSLSSSNQDSAAVGGAGTEDGGTSGDGQSGSGQGTDGQSGTSAATPQPSPSASQSQSAASTGPQTRFRSESGNIRCSIGQAGVVCHQRLIAYSRPASACDDIRGATVGLDDSDVTWPCLKTKILTGHILPYNHSIHAYGYTCHVSLKAGVKCENADGRGFTMEYYGGITTF